MLLDCHKTKLARSTSCALLLVF